MQASDPPKRERPGLWIAGALPDAAGVSFQNHPVALARLQDEMAFAEEDLRFFQEALEKKEAYLIY